MRPSYPRRGAAPARPRFSYPVPADDVGAAAAVLIRARTNSYADPSVVEQGSAVLADAIARARARAGGSRG